ncbi:hypothetical protein [Aestuariivirga sp.]|uniref:hypothetical protein n=1 Tax=Aestuariivirga sp. TaxID=2650926 RepID=UPI0039E569EE
MRSTIGRAGQASTSKIIFGLMILFCPIVFSSAVSQARASDSLVVADQGAEINFCGTILDEMFWGPPGFGETPAVDIKWRAWMLALDKPLKVQFTNAYKKTVAGEFVKIQVRPDDLLDRKAAQLLHHRVHIIGKLWSASVASDETPVTLWPRQIDQSSQGCDR